VEVRIVLLNPQEEGNIGSVARAMKNFGFKELYLVNPCDIGGGARAFASHGRDVLESAKTVSSFQAAVEGCDYVVGTTGKKGGRKTPKREAVTPEQLKEMHLAGKIALLFGNEASGIPNNILSKTDFVVRIPASPIYPILNLAQSVCIILYELSKKRFSKTVTGKPLAKTEREQLDRFTKEIIAKVYEQPHQKRFIFSTLNRIYGKSMLTAQESSRIISFYRKILRRIP